MTSVEIRQKFLDFFKSKGHSIMPSASLLPDSPNLLFTNAGMNQFVPFFLGQRPPDVSKWAGSIPGRDTRAADTQKCIRAGGKHNDLEDVGLDTYHHTFFEMLGNWSFGDYFKREAIAWAWELLTEVYGFPADRLYATVFCPYLGEQDWQARWAYDFNLSATSVPLKEVRIEEDVSTFEEGGADIEAIRCWIEKFKSAGRDPRVHIVPGGKKDNFWMMGETGPCGPCSEIHVDLTRQGDTKGSLVNQGSAKCIEIWNLVFIQFNANPDGGFSPLAAKHVDTGMGFERLTSFIQCTRNFTDFTRVISNYETDIFRSLFDKLETLSGKKYLSKLPSEARSTEGIDLIAYARDPQLQIDVAFRVVADHVRTLTFAIGDGILPSNEGRGYVLRRILRRAVRYGRSLGFHDPFFYKLAAVLADTMGHVFPEVRAKQEHVEEVIRREEQAFNKTLDRGIELFEEAVREYSAKARAHRELMRSFPNASDFGHSSAYATVQGESGSTQAIDSNSTVLAGFAFKLYDTYGFPRDLTELMAREHGLTVDVAGFDKLMEEQKARARAAQKKQVIELSQVEATSPTRFIGYDALEAPAKVLEIIDVKNKTAVILDTSPLYAEMGGQVGDTGELSSSGQLWRISETRKAGNTWLHFLGEHETRNTEHLLPLPGAAATLTVDRHRRFAIQRHHTVTHLLHWALHEVVSPDAVQKGSYVGPDKLTFDFSSAPLIPQQVADVERLVNERILDNAPVTWTEVKYDHIKDRKDIMQFFGEKYGDLVRVVQIGGKPASLDGYSMELCGGTHVRATGEIGLFRIAGESAIAAGIRRIEAVSGLEAYRHANEQLQLIRNLSGKVNSPAAELEKKIESLLADQKELEKQLKVMHQKQAAEVARGLTSKAQNFGSTPAIIENLGAGDGDFLQAVADALKGTFKGVVVLGSAANGAVALVATVSPEFTKQFQAGKIIQNIAPIVGGKGGGRPDNARGGGKDTTKLPEALTRAREGLTR